MTTQEIEELKELHVGDKIILHSSTNLGRSFAKSTLEILEIYFDTISKPKTFVRLKVSHSLSGNKDFSRVQVDSLDAIMRTVLLCNKDDGTVELVKAE